VSAYPTREECLTLLRESGCSQDVVDHCLAVEGLATNIARLCTASEATVELVSRGALLHDIGRSRTHGIQHAIEGAAILREKGFDHALVSIAERHIGAGLSLRDAVSLGLPPKDYFPETLSEKIVAQADNLIGHRENAVVRMHLSEALERAMSMELNDFANRMRELHEELSQMCGLDIDNI